MKVAIEEEPLPYLVVGDGCGSVFEIPELLMTGTGVARPALPRHEELISLPVGSDLFELPLRVPIGFDPRTRRFTEVREYRGRPVFAVAAFMAPAYVQIRRASYRTLPEAPRLPLYSYTAVGWRRGRFYAAGMRIDPDRRQDLDSLDLDLIKRRARRFLKEYPSNRLVRHLVENCVFRYGCPAARNAVLGRYEFPLPTSRACNASCLGCISEQRCGSGVNASHERIGFVPTPREIEECAVPHLEKAQRPVVSFGQGCEGEPLLVGKVIEEAIRRIRKRTTRGIINLNTNGSMPDVVERLCTAGLDSIRVSVSSARKRLYQKYYRPANYSYDDVVKSLSIVRRFGKWSSINYFVFPGLTDHPGEIAALDRLIGTTGINMIQTRNLNMDPEWYAAEMGIREEECRGIPRWIAHLRRTHPKLKLGYFNPPREEMTISTREKG